MAVVGHARIAERADEDRIELAQGRIAVGGNGDAGLEIMVCAPRKDFEIETAREDIVSRTNRFQRFVRDLNTDPITRDDRYAHDPGPLEP